MHHLDHNVLFGPLFVAGLAASLHCVGMCGPILLAFHGAIGRRPGGGRLEFLLYHAGRLWTYAMLGLGAGWLGMELREGSAYLGWQRPLSVTLSIAVILCGAAALGWIPGLKLDLSMSGCGFHKTGWLSSFVRDPRLVTRLLLGAVMGLLPCGMVYAMLMVVATMPSPLHSALGMLAFGAGTLPALSAVVLGSQAAPMWLRAQGPRIAAVLLVGVGFFMLARALMVDPGAAHMSH